MPTPKHPWISILHLGADSLLAGQSHGRLMCTGGMGRYGRARAFGLARKDEGGRAVDRCWTHRVTDGRRRGHPPLPAKASWFSSMWTESWADVNRCYGSMWMESWAGANGAVGRCGPSHGPLCSNIGDWQARDHRNEGSTDTLVITANVLVVFGVGSARFCRPFLLSWLSSAALPASSLRSRCARTGARMHARTHAVHDVAVNRAGFECPR